MKKAKVLSFSLIVCLLVTIVPAASAGPILILGNLNNATYLVGETAAPLDIGLSIIGTTYHWQKYTPLNWLNILDATQNTFTPPTSSAGTARYRCAKTLNGNTEYSSTVTITVLEKPTHALTPATQTIAFGNHAPFTETAANTDGWNLTHSYWAWGPIPDPAGITGDTSPYGSISQTTYSPTMNTAGTHYYFYVGEYTDQANGTKQVKVYSNGAKVIVNPAPVVNPFTDVQTTDWFYSDVISAYNKGLVNGTSATTYSPNSYLTLASAIKLAACMNQYYNTGHITLVNGTINWYDTYVDYAVSHGIIAASTYAGHYTDNATRAQYVKIFYYALPLAAYSQIQNVPSGKIPDVSVTDPYGPEVYAFYRAGILQGSDAIGSFTPNNNIRRSEVAAIISRMIDPANRITTPYAWAN